MAASRHRATAATSTSRRSPSALAASGKWAATWAESARQRRGAVPRDRWPPPGAGPHPSFRKGSCGCEASIATAAEGGTVAAWIALYDAIYGGIGPPIRKGLLCVLVIHVCHLVSHWCRPWRWASASWRRCRQHQRYRRRLGRCPGPARPGRLPGMPRGTTWPPVPGQCCGRRRRRWPQRRVSRSGPARCRTRRSCPSRSRTRCRCG